MPDVTSRARRTAPGFTLALLAAVAMLAGCAAPRDMRYLESRELPPLVIPEGLGAPAYTQTMEIPRPAAGTESPTDAQTAEDLELPPRRVVPES